MRPRFTVQSDRAGQAGRRARGPNAGPAVGPPAGPFTAADLWREFAGHGRLGVVGTGEGIGETPPSLPGEAIGGALSARTVVPPGEARELVA